MARLVRNTAILAKIESAYATDAAPTGADNAILISNQTINPLAAQNVDRALVRPYFGGSEQLLGPVYKEVSFDVELAGSGTAGTAPAWGPLLRACGFAQTIIAATRVDYTPVSTGFESLTIYYYDDGVVHKLLGARGEWSLNAKVGAKPTISFKFIGLDGGDVAGTPGTVTLSAFKTPLVVTNAFTLPLVLGGTVSPTGAPAITGGTTYTSQGVELASGNAVNHIPLIGSESVEITDRSVTGKVMLDMSAAQEVAQMAIVKAATLSSVGMVHGTTAGNKVLLFSPSAQFTNPSKGEVNGRRLIGYDLRIVPDPAGSGNDELRIAVF